MDKIKFIFESSNPLDLPEGELPEGFINSTETQTTEDETPSGEGETQTTEGDTQFEGTDTEWEQDTEIYTETKEPVFLTEIGNKLKTSPILCGALGVVLTLLIVAIWDSIRKNKAAQQLEKKEMDDAVEISQDENVISTLQSSEKVQPILDADKICGIGQRDDQQDSFGITDVKDVVLYQKRGLLAVVADGMGGLSNGGEISALVVKSCHSMFHELPEYKKPSDMLLEMANVANRNVNMYLQNGKRSGSTLVAAIIRDGYLYFLTVGDSHIYLYRNGAILNLNREHVYREELAVSAVNGEVPMERVKNDKQANSLTSYMGIGRIAHVDRNEDGIKLVAGDKIMLCSDGVYGTISKEQMEYVLKQDVHTAVKQIEEMIQRTDKPYQDNYTAVVLEYFGV